MKLKVGKKRQNAARETGDPFAEGHDAAMTRKPVTENPYPFFSDERALWQIGWDSYFEAQLDGVA